MTQAEKSTQQILNIFRVRELLTVIALFVSLLVTYNLWKTASHVAAQTVQTRFDFRVRESNNRIEQRMLIYEQVLRSTAGLFAATETVTRENFRTFVDMLNLAENYPGIHGVGFSLVVPPSEKQRHIAAIRAEGFPDYLIKPKGERGVYTSAVYLEPFFGSNLRAFGYDMYSEPTRRAAMEQARDTGRAAVSGKVTLIQEAVQEADSEVQAGFLMYLPVYRNNAPHDTLAQRRTNLIGWVYAPFRMDDFMEGISGERAGDLDVEIYDGRDISDKTKMYDADRTVSASDPRRPLRSVDRILAGNRTWTVITTALPAFEQRIGSDRPQLILQAGASISLLLALLIWLFLDDRGRALQAANQAMRLALYDALTGLPNRKLLDERLQQALAMEKRSHNKIALLFIDLDKFKLVNDNFGHAYGDLLLKEVAKRLQSCMRETDTACRLGGDEFVVLLSDIEGKNAAAMVAAKILNRLTQPYEMTGHTFHISASIGVALYPGDGADGKTLIKAADLAMYGAKKRGRSNVRFARDETENTLQ